MKRYSAAALMAPFLFTQAFAESEFWPVQEVPRGYVRVTNHEHLGTAPKLSSPLVPEGAFGATHVLAQSISGLAARAVNEGRGDEMVWIEVGHPQLHINTAYDLLHKNLMDRLGLEYRGSYGPWELVSRYRDRDIIKGYILYSHDQSEGGFEEIRPDMDHSLNLATSMAAHLGGILVEESLESQAIELELKLLYDARGVDIQEAISSNLDLFNTSIMGIMDPRVPNQRDYLITHGAAVHYGYDDLMDVLLGNLDPLSPIIGWNGGDERRHTRHVSQYAHFNTASNRVINMPLLTAGAVEARNSLQLWQAPSFSGSKEPAVSFVMSDGDNMSWFLGEIATSPDYMGNTNRVDHPITWTTCMATLLQMAPDGYRAILDVLVPEDGLSEFSGGYFFPEYFGQRRDEADLLRQYARRLSPFLEASGIRIFHFMVVDVASPEAMESYRIFAEELVGIEAMTVTQYVPYEGGRGDIYWIDNGRGDEIPVLTAAYALWEGRKDDHRGDPHHLAEMIKQQYRALGSDAETSEKFRWVVIHAWSHFPDARGNMRRGVEPVWDAIDLVREEVDVVTLQELVHRVREDRARRK